jgi:hypothetical protein
MKHILNNLTEEEKNSIREQHTDTLKVMTENFSRLVESKLGDVKPILLEQGTKKKHPYITKIGQVFRAIRDIDNKPYKLVVSTDPNRKDLSGNYWTDLGFDITGPGQWEGKPLINTGQFLTYDPKNPNLFWGNNALGYFTIIR